jgi:hypothetical protein
MKDLGSLTFHFALLVLALDQYEEVGAEGRKAHGDIHDIASVHAFDHFKMSRPVSCGARPLPSSIALNANCVAVNLIGVPGGNMMVAYPLIYASEKAVAALPVPGS